MRQWKHEKTIKVENGREAVLINTRGIRSPQHSIMLGSMPDDGDGTMLLRYVNPPPAKDGPEALTAWRNSLFTVIDAAVDHIRTTREQAAAQITTTEKRPRRRESGGASGLGELAARDAAAARAKIEADGEVFVRRERKKKSRNGRKAARAEADRKLRNEMRGK